MKNGRKCLLSDTIRKSILKDLSDGQTRECAAACAGITGRTLCNWLARGRKGEKPFASLLSEVKKAEHKAERVAVSAIRKAGKKSWQAYAWWLERKFPHLWASIADKIRGLAKRLDALEGGKRG